MMKKIFTLLTLAALFFSPTAALAASEQRQGIERYPFYDKYAELCGFGGVDEQVGRGAGGPGPVYLLGDSIGVGMQSAGIESMFSAKGFTPRLNVATSRGIQRGGQSAAPSGLDAVTVDAEFVKSAKYIVIELGTNLENNFSSLQSQLIQKIRGINPDAQLLWVDVYSSDNQAAYSQVNKTIYSNQSLGYKVISWSKLIAPTADPQNLTPTTTAFPITSYGVHTDAAGYKALAELVVNSVVLYSTFSGSTPPNTDIAAQPADPAATGTLTSLPASIPEPYRSIFPKAAAKFGTDVGILTAIFWIEHGGGFPNPPPPYGTGKAWASSNKGANGPFQFLNSTWASSGQDGNGDGVKDIQDLTDAAFGAANYIANSGGKAGIPVGSVERPNSINPSVVTVLIAYNAGGGRIAGANTLANLPKETQNYITRAIPFYLSLQGGIGTAAPTTAVGQDCIAAGTIATTTGQAGGLGVSADGFIFPLKTTKTAIKNASPVKWCYTSQTNCHHDYNAADIGAPTGTEVVAAVGGVVEGSNYSSSNGQNMRIRGNDGKWYFYTHMPRGSNKANKGNVVQAGQAIGVVGTAADAQNTGPHLHFDISPVPNGFSRGRDNCAAQCATLINPQPILIQAFAKLPE